MVERGLHHRVVKRIFISPKPNGTVVTNTESYTELADGLHYEDNGQLRESVAELEPDFVRGGAQGNKAQIRVHFARNIASHGAISITHEGKKFRAHVLGLAYTDAVSGQSVWIAEVQSSIGEIIAPNQVLYQAAFSDGIQADLRYTFSINGVEQDVLIRSANFPSPSAFGLPDATSRLEVFSEIVEAEQPRREGRILKRTEDNALRARMAFPDFTDETLDFGNLRMGEGKAFPMPTMEGDAAQILVGKKMFQHEGRHLLVESVEWPVVKPHVQKLPQARKTSTNGEISAIQKRQYGNLKDICKNFPVFEKSRSNPEEMAIAKTGDTKPAFVIDYQILAQQTISGAFVFKSDTTYLISGTVTFPATSSVVFEGGCVIKYSKTAGQIVIRTPPTWPDAPHQPVIFTASDDSSIGSTIGGTTSPPVPGAYYGVRALGLDYKDAPLVVRNAKFKFMNEVSYQLTGTSLHLQDAQIVNCKRGIWNLTSTNRHHNVLFAKVENAFPGTGTTAFERGAHLTFAQVTSLGVAKLFLTNSLLVGVTTGTTTGPGVHSTSDLNALQTVGGGAAYLPSTSPYKNVGVQFDPIMEAQIRKGTTMAPIYHVGTEFSGGSQFQKVVSPDDSQLDIGYHYPPVDYLMRNVTLKSGSYSVRPGVIFAVFYTGYDWGIKLSEESVFILEGTPENRIRLTQANLVQEDKSLAVPVSSTGSKIWTYDLVNESTGGAAPVAAMRFVDFHSSANSGWTFYAAFGDMPTFNFKDVAFFGGKITSKFPTLDFFNSLFERNYLAFNSQGPGAFVNCHFEKGELHLSFPGDNNHTFFNNVFNEVWLSSYLVPINGVPTPAYSASHGYNAYVGSLQPRLGPSVTSDVTLNSLQFYSGPFGKYYQGTTLVDQGNVTDSRYLGLFHYTTQASGAKEVDSRVDIGLHYVATDQESKLSDFDLDEIPDYAEDKNGNGDWENGETGFKGDLVSGLVFNPLPSGYPTLTPIQVYNSHQGASMFYTVDGTPPARSSFGLSSGQSVNPGLVESFTLRVGAFKTGYTPAFRTGTYIRTVGSPIVSPPGGVFRNSQQVTIAAPSGDAIVRYTLNGTEPMPTSPSVANNGTISMSQSSILKVKAFRGSKESATIQSSFMIGSPILNNEASNPIQLLAHEGHQSGATVGASKAIDDPSPTDGTPTYSSVWFNWECPSSEQYAFVAESSSSAFYITVQEQSSGGTWVNSSASYQQLDVTLSRVVFQAFQGKLYRLALFTT